MSSVKSLFTLAKLRKHLKPWSLPEFKARLLVDQWPCMLCGLFACMLAHMLEDRACRAAE